MMAASKKSRKFFRELKVIFLFLSLGVCVSRDILANFDMGFDKVYKFMQIMPVLAK